MRDDYSPKPAFDSYRALVSRLSLRSKPPPSVHGPRREPFFLVARCYRRGVYALVRGTGMRKAKRVRFRARGVKAVDEGRPWRRHIRLAPTRHRVRIRVRARVEFRRRPGAHLERGIRCRIRD
jgi:hypothetical protein